MKTKTPEKIIPKYSWIPIALVLFIFVLSFQGTRLINSGFYHYDFSVALDHKLPYAEPFIIVYVLAYFQWCIEFFLLSREEEKRVYKYSAAVIIGLLISAAVFIAFPTVMERPEASGVGITGLLAKFIFSADTPDNLFPSLHCYASWYCVRISFGRKGEKTVFKIMNLVFTLTVFVSVVLVKQHLIVDIIGGIVFAEAGMLITRLTGADRLLSKINNCVFAGTEEKKFENNRSHEKQRQ